MSISEEEYSLKGEREREGGREGEEGRRERVREGGKERGRGGRERKRETQHTFTHILLF